MRLIPQDLRLAIRRLAGTPGFTAVALLTLGLCVGANTAIFSVVSAVILRPLPFSQPEQIVRVRPESSVTTRMIEALDSETESYTALSGASATSLTLTGTDQPELVAATVVGWKHSRVFGLRPALGRSFLARDSTPGATAVVILGDGLWRRRFGADARIIGRSISLAGETQSSRTVIGVMPPGYRPFPWRSEALVPMVVEPGTHDFADMARYTLFGRLRPESSPGLATTELRAVLGRLARGSLPFHIDEEGARQARVVSEHGWRIQGVRQSLWLALASVGAVFLIGCFNIASLFLVRVMARQRELAVRRALGARSRRIVRLLLVESLVLGLGGGLGGYLAARLGLPALMTLLPSNIPNSEGISLDGTVLAFTLGASIAGTLLFGLLPAIRSCWAVEQVGLDPGRSTTEGRTKLRLNRTLVVAQVAICVGLVAAAGLFSRSLSSLRDIDPGFNPDGLYTARLTFSPSRYPDAAARRAVLERIEVRVGTLPGVESVGAIQVLPMTPGVLGVGISPDGNPVGEGERPWFVSYRMVTPGYMETTGISLLEGRFLESMDRAGNAAVGLLNVSMAQAMWPGGESAVGKEVRWDNGDLWFKVVGVVADIHQHSLTRAARAEAYVPYAQDGSSSSVHLMLRGSRSDLLVQARQIVWEIDPDIPVTSMGSMVEVVERSLATARFHRVLFGLFALLATVLAAVGVYGLTAYTVTLRAHEIAIRVAVGATRLDVMRWMVPTGVLPVALGLGIGLAGSLLGGRLIAGHLYGVTAGDPAVFAGVVVVLSLVAAGAMAIPARRAWSIDPAVSLHQE